MSVAQNSNIALSNLAETIMHLDKPIVIIIDMYAILRGTITTADPKEAIKEFQAIRRDLDVVNNQLSEINKSLVFYVIQYQPSVGATVHRYVASYENREEFNISPPIEAIKFHLQGTYNKVRAKHERWLNKRNKLLHEFDLLKVKKREYVEREEQLKYFEENRLPHLKKQINDRASYLNKIKIQLQQISDIPRMKEYLKVDKELK